jgi:DedD protein
MAATTAQDTEITLGTGKMLALFFGLVALCAVFFGMGFSLGRSSVKPIIADASSGTPAAASASRPSAVKPASATASSSDLTFYKAVENKDADGKLTATDNSKSANEVDTSASESKTTSDPAVAPAAMSGYYVQVAAVSKQEDARALVDALTKKQYPAFSTNVAADKLFHVQVGPYTDVKDAEIMRAKLVADGYNPILKK